MVDIDENRTDTLCVCLIFFEYIDRKKYRILLNHMSYYAKIKQSIGIEYVTSVTDITSVTNTNNVMIMLFI